MSTPPSDHPTSPVGALPPLSPSRANDFKSCPLKYRYRAIDRIPEPPSPAAARGTLVHSVLERLFEQPAAERTPEFTDQAVPSAWSDMVAREPVLDSLVPADELQTWFTTARELLHRYFTVEDPTRFTPAQRELRVEVTLEQGVPTRGFIDRVDESPDGLLRIVDYKTGKSPAAAFVDSALFQLKFYALMLYRQRGVVAARLRLIYLGDSNIVEYSPDLPGLLAFEASVATLWAAIQQAARTGEFRTRRSKLCHWCSFQSICPEFGGTPPPYPGLAPAPSSKSG